MRASLEIADIFRSAGPAYRASHAGHLSLHQLKVMSAIEHCRTAALGGHVEACTDCGHWRVAYSSCRNRHHRGAAYVGVGDDPPSACPHDVPGGGIAPEGERWISSRPAFLLPVRVLGALCRRLFLTRLMAFHDAGRLAFFGSMAHLAERRAFLRHLSPVRKKRWVVYAKAPFAGPEAVLAYLARYTHRVAISNSRLIAFDTDSVTFGYKDYGRSGPDRQQVMTLAADKFIHRFLLHVLPRGFHRIRHYGLLAASSRKTSLDLARKLLAVAPPAEDTGEEPADTRPPCPCCGGHMVVIETFERGHQPRAPPPGPSPNRAFTP